MSSLAGSPLGGFSLGPGLPLLLLGFVLGPQLPLWRPCLSDLCGGLFGPSLPLGSLFDGFPPFPLGCRAFCDGSGGDANGVEVIGEEVVCIHTPLKAAAQGSPSVAAGLLHQQLVKISITS